ncbi:uncharacterized protein PV06_07142 [Exophiala oligosperma]|uniref:Uncharacterized protein n=1 Tax=Exophiala oligosperma TaxID=215243 RepID=A0A0D2E1D2_9EURO|nr:uncharacterized protein PV06_07142 [Exophiala oligosperma]KIW41599.1 hypothetical protein PV06_07142 [Exophiala oligosperma]
MDNEGSETNQQIQSNHAISIELEVAENVNPYSPVGEVNEEERDDQPIEEEADEHCIELFLESHLGCSGRLFPPSCSNAPTPPSTPQRTATPRLGQRSSTNPIGSRGDNAADTTNGVTRPAQNIHPLALAPNGLGASQTS